MSSNVQTQIQKSWHNLANESAQVIAARLTMLPWQWMMAPDAAHAETNRMFSEKHEAMLETQWLMWQAPMQFWLDAMTLGLTNTPDRAFSRAASKASNRLIQPSSRRVRANRKRLNAG